MITNPIGKAIMVALLSCVLLLTSCAANYNSINPKPDTVRNDLHKGDTVRILTKSGRVFTFQIVEITENAIKGASQEILFSDIEEIKKIGTGTEEKASRKAAFNKYLLPMVIIGAMVIALVVVIHKEGGFGQ